MAEVSNQVDPYAVITYQGETLPIKQWAHEMGIPVGQLRRRLNKLSFGVAMAYRAPDLHQPVKLRSESRPLATWARVYNRDAMHVRRLLVRGLSLTEALKRASMIDGDKA